MAICAACGKPITMEQGSYYAKSPLDDIGNTYHSGCGDPLGIKAAVEAERKACADIADRAAKGTADGEGEIYIAHQIRDVILSRGRTV